MGRLISILLVLAFAALTSVTATGGDAAASTCRNDHTIGIEQQIVMAAPADVHHDQDGHDHEACCWDSLCFDPSHCHHATAPGLMPTAGTATATLIGHGVFRAGATSRLRPVVPRADLDPPRT